MLTNYYLVTTKNLESILNTILTAKAPERFTNKFLSDLGFTSSNDRLIIGILKAVGMLDENSAPTQRYFDFLDQTQSKKVLAEGIKEAYEDLFNLRIDAQNMTNDEVKNKLKTLTQGQKSEKVISMMAMTFKALGEYADWEKAKNITPKSEKEVINVKGNSSHEKTSIEDQKRLEETVNDRSKSLDLHYNIQIHLPETRDMAVYDAIFQSLKKHLI
ncbi:MULTISPECIES: DUF5343 domain-containing protein [Dehalobacter]|jgi:hypothetical protein|uniref:DUF5343 domain-containing protein n=2 Tax=Dehalobacter restrictus TaxID=55583 RepID=A0A857DK68_9FIRM|nr:MULTISPECIES: DUF5343 domain-containing protein [Dehalobacter]AHF11371.1 hypothetical protein DEHRE_08905 [Dehalobacter restrictus DSM 9455]MCG1024235.1 DUF5343 domain-containing protein [Dehalobacter sp.]MDJ0307162.1 DUF5343 domain-containing protein [Dehalobacter sp.]OCZ50466.1 hypothetical protein A7D23_14650 [Dehalobacter sp. TeCB1]QHA00775.1 hypothetical protein GQ588_09085 [Dehalobacter restrictus]